MLISELSRIELKSLLRGPGLHIDTGAFTARVRTDISPLVTDIAEMYADYPLVDPAGIDDFDVRISAPSWPRRFFRPQIASWIDGEQLIEPLPRAQALPCLESALNLGVAYLDVAPLVVHSAVLERDGSALVMPAPSGSGKSTLCAALAWNGWRLLSDEMAVFCFETRRLLANPRPVSLKNHAVDVIRQRAPHARFSAVYQGTSKGDIAYMRAPAESVRRACESAGPGLLVAPVYRRNAPLAIRQMERSEMFRWLTDNAVNYASMLRHGFDALADFVEGSRGYAMTYSDLDEAIDNILRLHQEAVAG